MLWKRNRIAKTLQTRANQRRLASRRRRTDSLLTDSGNFRLLMRSLLQVHFLKSRPSDPACLCVDGDVPELCQNVSRCTAVYIMTRLPELLPEFH